MASSLQTRVKHLETSAGGGNRCPECGFDGDYSKLKISTSWAPSSSEPTKNRYCSTCGRPTHVVITWGDAPD